MTSVTLIDAQAGLPELVHKMLPDEELVITENDLPVARLVGAKAFVPTVRLGQVMISIAAYDDEPDLEFETTLTSLLNSRAPSHKAT